MIRLFPVALVAWLLTTASCMEFRNPAPSGKQSDFSQNDVYAKGDTINMVWTPPEKAGQKVSITLFQMINTTKWVDDFEYIQQSVVDQTSFTWIVGTRQNLTFSNAFMMSIFEEGSTTSDANTEWFNISSKDTSPPPTITTSPETTSPTSAPSAAPRSMPSTAFSSTPNTAPSSTPSTAPSSTPSPIPSGGLSTGAKIGIGVGIPVAVLLGIGAGFFLFKQRWRHDNKTLMTGVPQGGYNKDGYHNGGYHSTAAYYGPVVEAPPRSPTEMAHSGPELDMTFQHHQPKSKAPSEGISVEPVRYELHAPDPQQR